MILKINCLSYKLYKKIVFSDLTFEVDSQEILGIYFENKFLQLFFLKILLGKKKPSNGNIYLNNENITTLLFKERKIGYVSAKFLRLSFLPIKLRLTFDIFKKPKFLHNSLLKYIKNKYFYKNLVFVGNDLNKDNLITRIDKIINEYFVNSIKIKEKWIETYLIQVSEFHKKEINKILENCNHLILIQSLYTFIYKKEKIRVYEGYITFLQALWDKIYYISDLDYLCDCYEISKKNKFKKKEFNFVGAKLVCKKYLKILHVEITYERYKLIKYRKALKKYKINVINEIINNNKLKNFVKGILNKNSSPNIIMWSNLAEKKWFDYNQKQEQLITNLLPDEAMIIKGKVFEYFHKYHLSLLNNTLECKKKDNSIRIIEANKKIISIYNQAFEEIKKLINNLNIKMNLFKFTKNLSSFDYIKIKLINLILSNKKLIILYNVFDNLTNNEANELNNILLNLKKYNPQLIFLILTKNIENINNYITQLLFFDKNNNFKLILKKYKEFLPDTISLYKIIYNSSKNIFLMKYFAKKNSLINKKINIKLPKQIKLINQNKYWLAINPKLISFEKTKKVNKELNLIYKGEIKTIKNVVKSIVCFFKVENDLVFKILLKEKELNLKKMTTIYFEKYAFLVYDAINNSLVANI